MGPPMIVVDANILIYRIVEGEMTAATLRLQEKDPDWRTSPLWLYEFGNALALMIHQKHLMPKMEISIIPNGQRSFYPRRNTGRFRPNLATHDRKKNKFL